MKNLTFLILALLLGVAISAQTPQSFRYQAVARDNSGVVLSNQDVSFRISILSGSVAGTTVYSETHTGKTTNAFGLIDLEIGKGTPVTGTFSSIDWGRNSYFVKVEMDPAGGTAYQVLSTSQLMSVPYALHSKTVETGDNWGTQVVVSDVTLTGNGTVAQPLSLADNAVTSSKISDGTITSADIGSNAVTSSRIADGTIAVADIASNAITTAKVANSAVTGEKIADGTITGAKIAQQAATSGQVLKWNGTTWSPAYDSSGPFVSIGGTTYNSYNLGDNFVIGSPSINDITGMTDDNIRMYFNKTKGAFRAGEAYLSDWDEANTGDYSVAMGFKTKATGKYSSAFGSLNTAAGWYCTSMGYGTLANAINSVAIGKYNVGSGNPSSWVPEDPIFEIGIGAAQVERQNAMTVLKNGNVGIGTATPTEKLDVAGQIKIRGGSPDYGKVLTSDVNGLASWKTPALGLDLPLHRDVASDGYVFSISNNSATADVPKVAIIGSSDSGTGIYGSTGANSKDYAGVMGVSTFIGSTGIYGKATQVNGSGIGVIGESLGDTGTGVHGTGYLHGVKGEGNKFGVRGVASGSTGSGVEGYALSETGETYGVKGRVNSSLGFSGYFEGGVFFVDSNVGVGVNEPTARVDIAGQIKIRGGSPEAGKVLTCYNNTGLATWQSLTNSPFSSSGGITSNTPITDHLVFGSALLDDASGTGDDIRLFFNKTMGAFRAGRATGTEWNAASVGNYSAAFGDNSKASGNGSFASGVASVASGSTSTAMGHFVNATAMLSTAVGSYNVGSGNPTSWVSTDPIFEIGNGTTNVARSNAVTVLKNGNTGIGTFSPSQKLHVKGSAAGNAVVFIEPNIWNAAGDYGEIRFGDANHYIRGEHTNGMTFYDTDKFNFTGGNVGIGTASPGYKLDVSGNRIRLIEAGTNDWIAMRTDGGSNDYLDFSWGGGSLVMQGATTNENIILNPSMNKVGIRTWSPMYDLDVTGNIRATGSVYYGGTAGSANGTAYIKPDYVFAEDYETMSVSEVEDFLKNKNHLPWVTSAKQEKHENGEATDMTRMAFETLETVENLQLQIIGQQKLIKEQLEIIESLQTRLEQIEKTLKTSK